MTTTPSPLTEEKSNWHIVEGTTVMNDYKCVKISDVVSAVELLRKKIDDWHEARGIKGNTYPMYYHKLIDEAFPIAKRKE